MRIGFLPNSNFGFIGKDRKLLEELGYELIIPDYKTRFEMLQKSLKFFKIVTYYMLGGPN